MAILAESLLLESQCKSVVLLVDLSGGVATVDWEMAETDASR